MQRKVRCQASSYFLAGLFLSMLVAFIAFDVDAAKRESNLRYEDNCRAVASGACPGQVSLTIRGSQGILVANAE